MHKANTVSIDAERDSIITYFVFYYNICVTIKTYD